MRPAIRPKANRSKNSGKFWVPCASANSPEVISSAAIRERKNDPDACIR